MIGADNMFVKTVVAELEITAENAVDELSEGRAVGAELLLTAVTVVQTDGMDGDTEIIEEESCISHVKDYPFHGMS